jgi:hypothetical protein
MALEAEGGFAPQDSYEDLTQMRLSDEDLARLVGGGGECVFSWTTTDGYPVGVVVAFIHRDGTFWTTCAEHRKRVPALRKRPQSSIVVNAGGRTATFKGDSTVHAPGDAGWEELSTWFYGALSGTTADPTNEYAASFRKLLDSPNRVIIETPAKLVVGFDSHKFGAVTQAAIEAGIA